MKRFNYLICLLIVLGGVTLSSAQKNKKYTKKQCYQLSYAYGAQIGQSLKAATMFTEEEKNADKFVEGLEEALKGDSLTIARANTAMQKRMQSQEKSKTPEAAGQVAYNIALTTGLGSLAQKVKVPTINLKAVKKGYIDGMTKESLEMTQPEMDSIFKRCLEPAIIKYQAIMQAEQEAKAAGAIEAGIAFLAANKEKEGVITTASGLQYEIIKKGKGAKATLEDKVKTHYHGTLIDGSVFDSSIDRGEPAVFGVGQVIAGWQEGIPLMSVGAQYRFYIPQELAYGMRAPSPKIPAGAVLIFDVELIEINPE